MSPFNDVYKNWGFEEYNNSFIAKIYQGGSFIYKGVAKTTIDGKTYEIDSEIDTLKMEIQVLSTLNTISKLDLSEGFNATSAAKVAESLKSISTEGLNEASKENVNDILAKVGDKAGVDLSNIDIEKINFEKAGDFVLDAYNLSTKSTITATEAITVLKEANDSGLVEVLNDAGVDFNFSASQKAELAEALASDNTMTAKEKADILALINK